MNEEINNHERIEINKYTISCQREMINTFGNVNRQIRENRY